MSTQQSNTQTESPLYDALIIGGGPAGLSAAIYLGRFRRNVCILDDGDGRSTFSQINDNYLGFPDGISTRELRELGRRQAQRFGAHIVERRADSLEITDDGFCAVAEGIAYRAKTLLIATGVCDIWPDIPEVERWVGCGVYWCITCDGYRAIDKRVVCIGSDDDAATTALQFQLFTRNITLVCDPECDNISEEKRAEVMRNGVKLIAGKPTEIIPSSDHETFEAVKLRDGQTLPCDMIFSLIGVRPNTQLAAEIGVRLDDQGYIAIDEEGYTSVPGVFAAGDLTKMYTQQVASAVHAGAEAAQTINYYLYANYQKNLGDCLPEATPLEAAMHGAL